MNSKNSQKKGSFSRWNLRSAQWYEEASAYTHYHDELRRIIEPHLSPEDTCCELACGTGTLARHLAPLTSSYTANDIDPQSIDFCNDLQAQAPVDHLQFVLGDWHTVFDNSSFDVVIFSYFGAILQDWETLKKLASRKVIAILPRYTEREMEEKKKAFSARSRFRSEADQTKAKEPRRKVKSFETMESVSEFLAQQHVSFQAIPMTLEFGQPCANPEEAEEYVRYYYRFEKEEEISAFVKEKFQPADCGYYFPKQKNIGIVIIDMER